MKFRLILIIAMSLGWAAAEEDSHEPERMKLWPNGAPLGNGEVEQVDVPITIHRPEKPNGTAMVICPGGGYGMLVRKGEGHGIAEWLNSHGITGIVLEYRLPRKRPEVPLLDAKRAIRTTRANAKEWGINADRIGIIGFSAGGHLASSAATLFDEGDPKSKDPIEQISSRPDFGILIYPVISMGELTHKGSRKNLIGPNPTDDLVERFSTEKQITEKTPPVFLAHALDDKVVVPANSAQFYKALQDHKVPAKYLELETGGHGFNGYKGPSWDAWQKQSLEWLKGLKLIEP